MNNKTTNILIFLLIIQTISLYNMLKTGNLNGDFSSFEVNINYAIVSFITSIFPYIIVWKVLNAMVQSQYIPISNFKHYGILIIILLAVNIFFSVKYSVGLYAQNKIYDVPIILKPLIVIVNKLDMYILTGLLLFSKYISQKTKVICVILLIILSISRASIFVFLFLFLVFIAIGLIKFRIKQIILFISILILTFDFIPKLFEYREQLRKGQDAQSITIYDNHELRDFMKSKLIGRVSSLSSVTYFYQNSDKLKYIVEDVGDFEYIIEFFRPFYGGIIRENKIGYTYHFTNFFDENAGIDYGIMYGLPSVFLLSYYKGLHILLLNLAFISLAIFLIIKLSSYLFGKKYKELSFVLLFYPIMSGVSSEFGQILLYLCFLSLLKLIYFTALHLNYKKLKL